MFNAGKTCVAIKRLNVRESIYSAVCDELAGSRGRRGGRGLEVVLRARSPARTTAFLADHRLVSAMTMLLPLRSS